MTQSSRSQNHHDLITQSSMDGRHTVLLSTSANLLEYVGMYKLVIMAVVVALLSGCATDNVQRILSADRATYKNVGISPALGSISKASVMRRK